jgi:hypothetical protein
MADETTKDMAIRFATENLMAKILDPSWTLNRETFESETVDAIEDALIINGDDGSFD